MSLVKRSRASPCSHFPTKRDNRTFIKHGVGKFPNTGGKVAEINKYTKVCEFHFKLEETKISLGRGIKTLKAGCEVPSVFKFKHRK